MPPLAVEPFDSRLELLDAIGLFAGLFAFLVHLLPREVLIVMTAIGSMATVYRFSACSSSW